MPDVLQLHCSPAVAFSAYKMMRMLASVKNTASTTCSADEGTGAAYVIQPRLMPLQLGPLLDVLAAHPATRAEFHAAAPTRLRVYDGPRFGALAQVRAPLADVLGIACRTSKRSVAEDAHEFMCRPCTRYTIAAARIDLCSLLNYVDALATVWLDENGGKIAFLVPQTKKK